ARAGLDATIDDFGRPARLTGGIGRRYYFDRTGMKPFPTASQALAAVEAARLIAESEQVAAADIDSILVKLPESQRAIVDRGGFPGSRFESIANVRYQVALALAAPERLLDVSRTPVFDSPGIRRLMSKIRVARARDLDRRYPAAWPAGVTVVARGHRRNRVVMHAVGDAERPLGWSGVVAQATAIAAPAAGAPAIQRLADQWRAAAP